MSSGSVSDELARAAGEQRGEQRREVLGHVGECVLEHRHDLAVDGPDDPHQLAPARLDVLELLLQERVALLQRVVLLERERVDRPHEAQVALEVARPTRERRALGHLGRGRVERGVGLDVVLGAQSLDRGLEPQPRLGIVDLGAAATARAPRPAPLEPAALGAQAAPAAGPSARAASDWRRRRAARRSCEIAGTLGVVGEQLRRARGTPWRRSVKRAPLGLGARPAQPRSRCRETGLDRPSRSREHGAPAARARHVLGGAGHAPRRARRGPSCTASFAPRARAASASAWLARDGLLERGLGDRGVTGPPMRHGALPPRRSPSGVTTTRSGCASARSSAVRHPASTTTTPASMRLDTC